MKIIVGDRQMGKTTRLIRRAKDCNGYIVVHSLESAKYVMKMAEEMGIKINFPLGYDDIITGTKLRGKKYQPLYIDNAEYFIQHVIYKGNTYVDAITMSSNDGNTLELLRNENPTEN